MKKLTSFSAIILLAVIHVSCSKSSPIIESGNVITSAGLGATQSQVKIASSWFSPAFTIVNDRSSIYLSADCEAATALNYERVTHIELGYAKLTYQGSSVFKRLPQHLSYTASNVCEINFSLTTTKCIVTLREEPRNSVPVILSNPFPDLRIRYIVISRALFESLSINWDDYNAVATALNI